MLASAAAWQLVALVILVAIVAPLVKLGRPGTMRRRHAAPATDWSALRREARGAARLSRAAAATLAPLPAVRPRRPADPMVDAPPADDGWPAPPSPWRSPATSVWPAPVGRGSASPTVARPLTPRRPARRGPWSPPIGLCRLATVLTPDSSTVAWDLARHPVVVR